MLYHNNQVNIVCCSRYVRFCQKRCSHLFVYYVNFGRCLYLSDNEILNNITVGWRLKMRIESGFSFVQRYTKIRTMKGQRTWNRRIVLRSACHCGILLTCWYYCEIKISLNRYGVFIHDLEECQNTKSYNSE